MARQKYKWIKQNGKYKAEHRIIMETFLGRKLDFNELVHHIDGNRLNNDINNLQLTTREEHTSKHHSGLKKQGNYNPHNKIKEPQIKLIIEYYLKGLSYLEISKIVGISDSTVRLYCIKYKNVNSQRKTS